MPVIILYVIQYLLSNFSSRWMWWQQWTWRRWRANKELQEKSNTNLREIKGSLTLWNNSENFLHTPKIEQKLSTFQYKIFPRRCGLPGQHPIDWSWWSINHRLLFASNLCIVNCNLWMHVRCEIYIICKIINTCKSNLNYLIT